MHRLHRFFAGAADTALWRLSVRSTVPNVELGGAQLIEWNGGLRWLAADAKVNPTRLRAWAQSNGGHATLFRASDKSPGVFHPLPEALLGLHWRLKAVFDPHHVLNPGRLYGVF